MLTENALVSFSSSGPMGTNKDNGGLRSLERWRSARNYWISISENLGSTSGVNQIVFFMYPLTLAAMDPRADLKLTC